MKIKKDEKIMNLQPKISIALIKKLILKTSPN